jgi:hypothetical protein
MQTEGLEGILVETHNWGKTVAFWQGLGYELQFETDHHSGQLRHPRGGPYIFIAERPLDQVPRVVLAVAVTDAAQFTPPHAAKVVHGFEKQHWPGLEMLLEDPDGRELGVHAPLPRTKKQAAKKTVSGGSRGKRARHAG